MAKKELETLKSRLTQIYRDFSDSLKEKYSKVACLSAAEVGSEYQSGGIVFYGRARNGYNTSWENVQEQFAGDQSVLKSIQEARQRPIWGDTSWLLEGQGRSAFCRVINKISQELYGDSWTDYIAVSNLYKLTWYDSGNPSNSMCNDQYVYCRDILKLELDVLCPSVAVFMTDTWANDFLMDLGFEIDGFKSHKWVAWKNGQQSEIRVYEYKDTKIVVTQRPETRIEDNLVEALLKIVKLN